MKNICSIVMFTTLSLFHIHVYAKDLVQCSEKTFQKSDESLLGHYYLHDAMEVGSELLLQPNGQFK